LTCDIVCFCKNGPVYATVGMINNGNITEWSPIRSVTIRVINKSDDRETGDLFIKYEYNYRLNWTTRCLVTN